MTITTVDIEQLLRLSCELYERGKRDGKRELAIDLLELDIHSLPSDELHDALQDALDEAEGAS